MDVHQNWSAVWIVGGWKHAEFTAPLLWLQERALCRRFTQPGDALEAADAAIGDGAGTAPQAILFLQTRPGQIAAEAVEALHRRFPLARLATLVGPWCEGELRGGQALPGMGRVAWRTWRSRLANELGLTPSCGWRPPRAASDSERLVMSLAGWNHRKPGLLALIYSVQRNRFESLRNCLKLLGVRSLWQWPGAPLDKDAADVVFVDGWENWPAAAYGLGTRSGALAPPPHVLLLHFPRPEDMARAEALGAAATIAEPMLLTDLAWTLDAVLPAKNQASSSIAH